VVGNFEPVTLSNGMLATLDILIHKFLDMPTINALDVIMMSAFVELEDGHAVREMMTRDETRRLELG
jgi:hypothetical protein